MTTVDPVREMALRWQTSFRLGDMLKENIFVKCVLRSMYPLHSLTALVDRYELQSPHARIVWDCWVFAADRVVEVRGHEARQVAWDALSDVERAWLDGIPWQWGWSDYPKILGRAAGVKYRAKIRRPRLPVVPKEA